MNSKSTNLRTQAARDRSSGVKDLLKQLRGADPATLSDRDLDHLKRLSAAERLKLFARLATPNAVKPTKPQTFQNSAGLTGHWYRLPAFVRRQLTAALLASLCMLGWPAYSYAEQAYIATVPISNNAANWPYCPRLNSRIDGCRYIVQSSILWQDAVSSLQIPAADLSKHNTHLACCTAPLTKGDVLVVWRGTRPLEYSQ